MHCNVIIIDQHFHGLNPMQFGHEDCTPLHAFGPAVRTHWLLHYVVSGFGKFTRESITYDIGPGEIFVIPPYMETYYQADERHPWKYIWIGFTTENIPEVFTADMNVKEGSNNYKEIADNSIFKDTKYTAENVYDYITFHDRFPEEHPDSVIDYCFANEGFEAITYCVVTESPSEYYVSDHFPVYTDLRFK